MNRAGDFGFPRSKQRTRCVVQVDAGVTVPMGTGKLEIRLR
jgi:hypothetical protein